MKAREAVPSGESSSFARDVLFYLAGFHHDFDVLVQRFGRETMIQSSIWQAAWIEGKALGRAEGLRQACVESIKRRHPTLLPKALPAIDACQDHAVLCDWILKAADLDATSFARLLGIG